MARVNPDQALLKRFLADPATPVAIDSNPLGPALRAKLCGRKGDTLRISFEPGREFLQGNDVVQGGIVATMLAGRSDGRNREPDSFVSSRGAAGAASGNRAGGARRPPADLCARSAPERAGRCPVGDCKCGDVCSRDAGRAWVIASLRHGL